MNIPKTVKIGAASYRVKMEREPFEATDEPGSKKDNVGEHLPCLRVIRIAQCSHGKRMPEESMTDTFLHEVLHGVSRVYGIDLTENQVCGLTGGLMQVIRDNKLDFR